SHLFRHVSAWQYRVWMFQSDFTGVFTKFIAFLIRIPADIGWMTTLFAIVGFWMTIRRRLFFGYLMLATWLIGTIYNMNYDIPDISSYFLIFYCPLYIMAVIGAGDVLSVIVRFTRISYWKMAWSVLMILSIPLSAALGGDLFRQRLTYDFTRRFIHEVIATLPDSALVFHGDWDIQSPYLYYHHVEALRPDIVLLDISLMQRSWYIEQERRNHPDIFRGSERQAEAFLRAVEGFESGKRYDAQRLEAAFVELHNSIIRSQLSHRPVYIRDTEELRHGGIAAPYPKLPGGYFIRIAPVGSATEPVFRAENVLQEGYCFDPRERRLLASAAQAALWQVGYARQVNDTARVSETLNAAMMLNGSDPHVRSQVQRIRSEMQARLP
ncbi:MAG: hypothetical protein PHI18_03225, partial [bacterium]|nr:hypothetical protein [bacterium]